MAEEPLVSVPFRLMREEVLRPVLLDLRPAPAMGEGQVAVPRVERALTEITGSLLLRHEGQSTPYWK